MTDVLNEQQQAAVDSSACDLFITAGAGSGKTRVLTERYAKSAEDLGHDVLDSVLTITFTDKAAGEIAERVRGRLAGQPACAEIARDLDSAWISTIHGMCARLLRRHALEAGIDPLFVVGSEVQLAVLRQEAFEQVAKAVLDAGDERAELFRSIAPDRLFERVESIAEQLCSLGQTASDVGVHHPDWRRLESAGRELEELLEEYDSQPKMTTTIEDNVEAAQEVLAAVTSMLEQRGAPSGLAFRVGCIKQAKRGSQELKDLAERGGEICQHVALFAAQLAVIPLEKAFLDVVDRYQRAFEQLKIREQILDFEDLQSRTIDLFERHPDIARRYADRFTAVMIDEFQDTNVMQTRIIEAVAPRGFVTVGDEKQSIYRFRYADVELFRRKAGNSSAVLPLAVNYRSHPALLEFFNDLFSASPFWSDGYLRLEPGASSSEDPRAEALLGPSRVTAIMIDANSCGKNKHADEARVIAAHIRELVDGGEAQGDIVILMRAMTHADTYAAALRDQGLEAFVASGGTYFDRPEVTDLEMLLRVVANPLDDEALAHILAGPLTGLSDDAMGLLRLHAGRGDLWHAVTEADSAVLPAEDLARLRTVVEALEWARRGVGRAGLADLMHDLCEELEFDITLFARGFEGARAWANVLKLIRLAEEFELNNPGDPHAFLEHLRLKREHEGREALAAFAAEDVDAVRIMSVHAAKGLQFPITIMATLGHQFSAQRDIILGVSEGCATLGMKLVNPEGGPAIKTEGFIRVEQAEAVADLEESKRVFYVGCTRAEKALILCGRADLSKPTGERLAIDWVRSALGFSEAGDLQAGDYALGSSMVRVLCPEPQSCEMPGSLRQPVDEATLERARGTIDRPAAVAGMVVERISYSGLDRYRSCPYRYYATAVARLGSQLELDPDADSPTALGSAVHMLLRVVRDNTMPTQERMAEICRSARLAPGQWGKAESLAAAFLDSDAARRIARCERVMREVPFAVPVGGVLLDGVIDLIAWDGDAAIVLDYKTGHTDDRFDPMEKYRAQAECYAVAAAQMGASTVAVEFVELENEMRTRRFEFDPTQVAAARERTEVTLRAISSGQFEHLKHYEALVCRECPALGNLCPISAPPRRAV